MASPKVASALQSASSGSSSEKASIYTNLLSDVLSKPTGSDDAYSTDLISYIDSLVSSSLGIITIRPLLTSLIQTLASTSSEVQVQVGSHLVDILQSQIASFEEQDATVREILAGGYEAQEEYSSAAKALQGIHLDSTQRSVSDLAKVQTWIRIVRYFLEDDDTVSAETALNKIKNSAAAAQVLNGSPDLQLHYQLSQARILDSRRDFLNASAEYLNVSLSSSVAEEDRLQALSAAIKTAVLAGAGPQRSKTLGKLYKDERAVETQEYGILEKMFLDRILAPAEVEAFAASLARHQLAETADGSTVLSKAVVEHNLLAASRLYENISTAALAEILGLTAGKDETAAEKAEDYAARMIEQGRLRAQIDQIDGVITFEAVPGIELKGSTRDLRLWDAAVQGLVEDVERVAAGLSESFPVRGNVDSNHNDKLTTSQALLSESSMVR